MITESSVPKKSANKSKMISTSFIEISNKQHMNLIMVIFAELKMRNWLDVTIIIKHHTKINTFVLEKNRCEEQKKDF